MYIVSVPVVDWTYLAKVLQFWVLAKRGNFVMS